MPFDATKKYVLPLTQILPWEDIEFYENHSLRTTLASKGDAEFGGLIKVDLKHPVKKIKEQKFFPSCPKSKKAAVLLFTYYVENMDLLIARRSIARMDLRSEKLSCDCSQKKLYRCQNENKMDFFAHLLYGSCKTRKGSKFWTKTID